MAQPPSFGSNNPFRRKAPVPSAPVISSSPFAEVDTPNPPTPEITSALPPADRFRNQLQALAGPSQPPPATSFQKAKVVKRVRVQSPPPPSPESPEPPDRFSSVDNEDDESVSSDDASEQLDPFTSAASAGASDVSDREDEHQPAPSGRPPPNPFQKTLRDLEEGATTHPTQDSGAAPGTRGALDVGAFGRLLLTGQTGSSESSQSAVPYAQNARSPPSLSGDGASATDATPAPRQSIPDTFQAEQDTSRTSQEASERGLEDERRRQTSKDRPSLQSAPSIAKKPPPPPSSRHGKLINPGAGGGEAKRVDARAMPPLPSPRRTAPVPLASPSMQGSPTPSDVHKPLPPAPLRSPAEEESESVCDREAAGKLPEPEFETGLNIIMPPRPPTPPNVSHARSGAPNAAVSQGQPTKKPVPPPRRQPHGRTESKTSSGATSMTHQDDTDSSLRRSSFESTRSRSSSLRVSVHAPAPPPPRRPSHPPRAPSSHASPPPPEPHSISEPPPMLTPLVVDTPPPMSDTPTSSASTSSSGREPPPAPLSISHAPAPLAPPAGTDASPNHLPGHAKLAPPPPPPARNPSVRAKRPPAGSTPAASDGAPARRSSGAGRAKDGPTPPPPPRHRVSSRGSVDGPALAAGAGAAATAATATAAGGGGGGGSSGSGSGGTSETQTGVNLAAVAENGGVDVGGPNPEEQAMASESAAGHILADLSALQREVDALRGRYEKAAQGLGG
ncbi:a8b2b81a-7c81-485c-8e8e-6a837fb4fd20 [Thermothielavioides terrestris]|uniref:A8b2b81a-7c81-485c-8e8e-6a837fb4fd20 n=1 Tax=Thermothielavioides terrestris TaxID=2587410 RepID=A0A446BQF5_9PEZI|nr:a8b2b81a-7c81-485c-8e8e-6a837fb4fd20 [Thermothielavioides terrestris]